MAIFRRKNPQILRRERRLQQIQKATKIQKVAHFLRSNNGNSSDYDPKVVSLGPYHHGKPELQLFQEFKKTTLEMFVSGGDKDTGFYYNMVLRVVGDVRGCYVDGSTALYDDAKFAEMMLLDACFILNHIMIITRVGDASRCSITDGLIGFIGLRFIEHDMILLENQIPLGIIELLFNARYGNITRANSISDGNTDESEECYYPWKEMLSRYCQECLFGQCFNGGDYRDEAVPPHLLEAFRMHLVSDCERAQKVEPSHESARDDHYFFRSVMDLKSKGIHFTCNNKVRSLRGGVKFESYKLYTELELPIWYASPQSRVLFTNIIAYELCPNSNTGLEMISCINFMKSLIVSPADG